MRLQQLFDNDALAVLPKVWEALGKAEQFERDQMRSYALRAINNSLIALDSMTDAELIQFDDDLIDIFTHHRWIDDGASVDAAQAARDEQVAAATASASAVVYGD